MVAHAKSSINTGVAHNFAASAKTDKYGTCYGSERYV